MIQLNSDKRSYMQNLRVSLPIASRRSNALMTRDHLFQKSARGHGHNALVSSASIESTAISEDWEG